MKSKQTKPSTEPVRIYCDGAGRKPDGKGGAFAWLREDDSQPHVERKDGLTNNQAEYLAVLSAVRALAPSMRAEIRSDSALLCNHFNGSFRVTTPHLVALMDQIRQEISKRRLSVSVVWISRKENKAGGLV